MIWKLLWLFLIYSFAGWVLETVLASLKQKKFANRGIINGPFCLIYGFGGFFITAFTRELTGIWLFLGCAIVASLLEWIAGHLIEMWYHERWWDSPDYQVESGWICQRTDLLCLGSSWCICDQNWKRALHVFVQSSSGTYKQNSHTGSDGISGSGCYCHTDHPFWAQQES